MIVDFFDLDPAKPDGVCAVKKCTNARTGRHRYCRRCRNQRYRATNYLGYTYDKLRWSAKKRGIEFLLTIEEFGKWCAETGYLELKGRSQDAMTVDRIKSDQGYKMGNIRILSNIENATKGDRSMHGIEPDDRPHDPYGCGD